MLGSFAGSVALTFGAHGGVYIGGGILPKLGELFFQSEFRSRFEAKGRFREYLAAIPTPLLVAPDLALIGAGQSIKSFIENR
jgi:glucokinase